MGALGSDAAIEAADVVLMTDEPSKIVNAIKLSKKTMKIVKQNIIFAISVKIHSINIKCNWNINHVASSICRCRSIYFSNNKCTKSIKSKKNNNI